MLDDNQVEVFALKVNIDIGPGTCLHFLSPLKEYREIFSVQGIGNCCFVNRNAVNIIRSAVLK